MRVIGYGSHVDAARLKAARKAGCDEVLPRSAFFEDLQTKLQKWVRESNNDGTVMLSKMEVAMACDCRDGNCRCYTRACMASA